MKKEFASYSTNMIFDLHCDTLTRFENLENNEGQIDFSRLKSVPYTAQVFAVFLPNNYADKFKLALKYFSHLDAVVKKNANSFSLRQQEGKVLVLKSIENGAIIEGSIAKLDKLISAGIKIFGLVWNEKNDIAAPNDVKNNSANNIDGLSEFGYKIIKHLEINKIVIDLSHASDKTFDDVCTVARRPFICTHSNSRHVCDKVRNLTDEQIKKIIACRGLIGLNLYREFLGDGCDDMESLKAHIRHFLSLGGAKTLALGTDFDGIPPNPPFLDCLTLKDLRQELLIEFGEDVTSGILRDNATTFFKKFEE